MRTRLPQSLTRTGERAGVVQYIKGCVCIQIKGLEVIQAEGCNCCCHRSVETREDVQEQACGSRQSREGFSGFLGLADSVRDESNMLKLLVWRVCLLHLMCSMSVSDSFESLEQTCVLRGCGLRGDAV